MTYGLVAPEHFTPAHKRFIEEFKQAVCVVSTHTDLIMGAKDVYSRHLISTDAFARIVHLPRGGDVIDRFDRDMPCEGTAQFADCYVEEDRRLLHNSDIDKHVSVLNVHEYADGVKARIFRKHLLKHHASSSILGTIYLGHAIEIANFFNLIPNYIIEFGVGCSLESIEGGLEIDSMQLLTEYEHEVCFLLIMNWNLKQIAGFMNKYRPSPTERSADTISKCGNRIGEKLGIPGTHLRGLREKLIHLGVHRKMPRSFFNRLIGSRPLE